ncbi:hypothetical protein [Mangrovimonas sp. CR14]|uniref:hypothetical protein n=1 Tax=Mangrovimonas sp. CR14 TaxID=2706120 RepID=UPI001F0FEC5D|nr:hypothetical protein [Mangrovimonas sp. CR14]
MSQTEFEQAVLYEIAPSIIDSIFYDRRILPPPPPLPDVFEKEAFNKDIDRAIDTYKNSDKYKDKMRKWERVKDSVERDESLIFLIVSDSIDTKYGSNYRIDVNKLKSNNKKIRFKYRSEFPSGNELWRPNDDYFIAAEIDFSSISFDNTKNNGVLNVGYSMGALNGVGFRIYIKKNENEKWTIDKIVSTWIS